MSIVAFEQLSEEEKLKAVMHRGMVISERKDERSLVFLYYLETFYVAIKYSIPSDELMSIEAFERIGRKDRAEWKEFRDPAGSSRGYVREIRRV